MIKAASICTQEIDNIDIACRQLKEQLNQKLVLMKFSAGIIQCSHEFIETGIMDRLCKELGFPLAGGTTVASATSDVIGSIVFSVLVLTSDDVEFVVSHTQGLEKDCHGAVSRSFAQTLARPRQLASEPLKLAVVFPPIIETHAGDCYVEAIENICGNIPVFGSLSVDDSLETFSNSASICNNNAFRYEMTYVLFFGNVSPRFLLTTVPEQISFTESNAVITKASGNIVYEINDMKTIDYFESIGFAAGGKLKEGITFVPLLMKLPGDTYKVPFVRALIGTNPDGSAVLRGKVIEGATFTIGSTLGTDILSSTQETITGITREKNINAALLFSCIVRQLVIGADSMRELTMAKELLAANTPFMASYAGGEIAPTSVDAGNKAENRFHNYSFIVCLL